ncbi:hypothetical protein BJ912DRAFT_947925 [Pholiota molesta]|nr:hypothetical protein BJ912DRAFT_947925 [Pholiota molesta]
MLLLWAEKVDPGRRMALASTTPPTSSCSSSGYVGGGVRGSGGGVGVWGAFVVDVPAAEGGDVDADPDADAGNGVDSGEDGLEGDDGTDPRGVREGEANHERVRAGGGGGVGRGGTGTAGAGGGECGGPCSKAGVGGCTWNAGGEVGSGDGMDGGMGDSAGDASGAASAALSAPMADAAGTLGINTGSAAALSAIGVRAGAGRAGCLPLARVMEVSHDVDEDAAGGWMMVAWGVGWVCTERGSAGSGVPLDGLVEGLRGLA